MKEFVKIQIGEYKDKESEEIRTETDISEILRSGEEIRIVDQNGEDITLKELADLFVRTAQKQSPEESIFETVKGYFSSGKSVASSLLQDILYAGYGAIVTTEKKAREMADQMVASGKVSKEKAEEWFQKTKSQLSERERHIEKKAKEVIQKVLSDLGIATREDLQRTIADAVQKATEDLQKELETLRKKVSKLEQK